MKRQDVAFGYLFISLFANIRKELKACELFRRGKVFIFFIFFSLFVFLAANQ